MAGICGAELPIVRLQLDAHACVHPGAGRHIASLHRSVIGRWFRVTCFMMHGLRRTPADSAALPFEDESTCRRLMGHLSLCNRL